MAKPNTNAEARRSKKTLRALARDQRRARTIAQRASTAGINDVEAAALIIIRALSKPERPSNGAAAPIMRRSPGRASATIARSLTITTTRPRNARGEITIHFKQKRLTKGNRTGSAAGHQRYIEREQAQDRLSAEEQTQDPEVARGQAEQHQDYVEREGAVDLINPVARYWQPNSNMPLEMQDGIAVFGNIGETPEARRRFWDAVTEYETPAGLGFLRIYATQEQWTALMLRNDRPAALDAAVPFVWTHRRDPSDAGEVAVDDPAPPEIEIWRMPLNTPDMDQVFAWLQQHLPGPRALRHEPGPAGRIQYRIEAELPHELTSEQRYALVWEWAQIFRDNGLPYFAALHRPDQVKNHPLNWHLHFDYYDRPIKYHPETSLWDIEIKVDGDNRHPSSEHIPNKLREVNHRAWIPMLRAKFVEITNRHLAAAGHAKRYTALSYKDAEIDAQPTKHHGPASHAMEARGLATRRGAEIAVDQHGRMQRELDKGYQRELARGVAKIKALGYDPEKPPNQQQVARRMTEYLTLHREGADLWRRRATNTRKLQIALGRRGRRERWLTKEIQLLEITQREHPGSVRSPEGLQRRLTTYRGELKEISAEIKAIKDPSDREWGELETEYLAAQPERDRMNQLLAELRGIGRRRVDRRHLDRSLRTQRNAEQFKSQRVVAQRRATARRPAAPRPVALPTPAHQPHILPRAAHHDGVGPQQPTTPVPSAVPTQIPSQVPTPPAPPTPTAPAPTAPAPRPAPRIRPPTA
jgi:hypothetical protein